MVVFDHESSLEALKIARDKEREAAERYRQCLAEARQSGTRRVIELLIKDEEHHFSIVNAILVQSSAKTGLKGDQPKEVLTDILLADRERFTAEKASVTAMLKEALLSEKESFELYSRLAKQATSDETAAVLLWLAEEENRHYILVDNMLDFLADPSTWIYEEENLIFNL